MIQLRLSIFIFLIALILSLSAEVIYQGTTIETQAHTIQEQLGQAVGPDATPQPPKALIPPVVEPKEPKALIPPIGPEQPQSFTDQRRWQKEL
jgi:hypothetical protein